MKITELKCFACNGTMKVDPENPNYAECEYCGTKYVIEWDKTGLNGGPGDGNPCLKRMPEPIRYQRVPPLRPARKKTGWDPYGWKRGTALAGAFLLIWGVIYGPGVFRRYEMNREVKTWEAAARESGGEQRAADEGREQPAETVRLEGLLGEFAERVFEQPVEAMTEKQLADIKWMELRTTADFQEIGYSFENPFENAQAELTRVRFSREDYPDLNLSCLPAFPGLKMLATNRSLTAKEVKGLSLEGIRGYFANLEEVASLLEDTQAVREIDLTGSTLSLEGAEQFPNLEILGLNCDRIDEPKSLVKLKSLKALSIDMYDQGMDFSVIGMMPWLECVTVSSQKLKDIGFLSGMSELKELSLSYGEFLNLDPLKNCTGLERLSVECCDEIKDMSALSVLTGLKKLRIDLPYGCPEPDLSSLTAMEELYLESFEQTGFLRSMPELTTMTLDSCRVDTPSDFDGLEKLTTLNCTSFGAMERDYGFVTRLPALEKLNLRGTHTYEDISGIFNMPTLKYLNIGGMECEINFDRIRENPTLETLVIDKIKLYQNVSVSGGNGFYSVSWDDVGLAENLSFLEKLKGLRTLSIKENELTDLTFASALPSLYSIDFSDNYITDLSPLSGLKALREVICTENPVSNFEVLSDSVMVTR